MVKHKNHPQTLADYLAGIALEPTAARVQVHTMVRQLRERLALLQIVEVGAYISRPDRLDELLLMAGQLYALLSAFKALCQGRKPEEIDFVSLPQVVSDKSSSVAPTPGAKPKAAYPGAGFSLSVEESARPSAEVLDDDSRLSHMVIPIILRAKLLTLGQIIERWQYKDRRLMSLPGIGPAAIAKVIRPRVAKALGIPEAALGNSAAKGDKKTAKRGSKAKGAVTKLVNMDEPWLAFGLTREQWDTRLWDLLTEKLFEAKKLRKLIGRRRRLTVGDVLGPTKGKMARIKKTFFGKGFGPKTQHYLKAKLAALRVPQTMTVITLAPSVPAVEEGKQ